jgi:sulfatase-like protein
MTDLITRRAVEFITQNAGRPFFIHMAFNAPHSPTQPPDNPARASGPGGATRVDYAAVMECVDPGVAEIPQTLRRRA